MADVQVKRMRATVAMAVIILSFSFGKSVKDSNQSVACRGGTQTKSLRYKTSVQLIMEFTIRPTKKRDTPRL